MQDKETSVGHPLGDTDIRADVSVYWFLLGLGLVALLIACFEDRRRICRLWAEQTSTTS